MSTAAAKTDTTPEVHTGERPHPQDIFYVKIALTLALMTGLAAGTGRGLNTSRSLRGQRLSRMKALVSRDPIAPLAWKTPSSSWLRSPSKA